MAAVGSRAAILPNSSFRARAESVEAAERSAAEGQIASLLSSDEIVSRARLAQRNSPSSW
jgi:hypothetical protein